MKKKMREAALEQSAKELQDRVAQLEGEVETLRTENEWLRGLITTDKLDPATAAGSGPDLVVRPEAKPARTGETA